MSEPPQASEKLQKAKWWLVTWNTYGTWLPGDPRGFETWRGRRYVPPPKRYAKPDEPTYQAEEYADEYERAIAITGRPVRLTKAQQELALAAVVEEISKHKMIPAILAHGGNHAHLLAIFGSLRIRTLVGKFKTEATHELRKVGLKAKTIWSNGCNMKSKSTRREYENAFAYVLRHASDGFSIHQWTVDAKYIPEN